MEKIRELSVFFPAYNEEKNIKNTVTEAKRVLESFAQDWEIIIVNDGSKDSTEEVVRKLTSDKRVRLINHKTNLGYGEALKTGFYSSRYEWIATIDADGQFDFSEISKLYQKTDKAEVVIGYRLDRKDSVLRKVFGWGWTLLANILLGISVKDVDCAFKLIKREVIEKIPHLESTRGGMISPELLAKAKKAGFRIAQVGVHHFPRKEGSQTGAKLTVILTSFIDLFKLWNKLR
jgi:glycosyltransferase involved in cell wall biosynthesis